MGNRNARGQAGNIANYGMEYDPYYNYGEIENYGSAYQPAGGGYPFGFGVTDGPLMTTVKPPLGGLGAYGNSYPPGFNPNLQPGVNGPKVRVIYVPSHIVHGMQNAVQSGASPLVGYGNGVNPMAGGIGGIGGMGGCNPMGGGFGGMGGCNPIGGGFGGQGFPQMMPQMPMGSNCCALSVQVPSAAPQFPYATPCPPPMIQPMMHQMPMCKITRAFLSFRPLPARP